MPCQNLGEFLRGNSLAHKNRIAYEIKRGLRIQRFTFQDVYSLARKTVSLFNKNGLGKGDRVAIWAPNMPEYPILYFACWLLGVIAVPIDVRTTAETAKVFLTKAKCKVGFKGKFIPGSFDKLVDESFYLEDLVDLIKDLPSTIHLPSIQSNDLAEITFTSGTTGTPKGVMLTHENFLSDVEALTISFPFKKEYRALSILPLSHAFEQVVDFLAPYREGVTVTYLERINTLTTLRALKKGKITSVALVPQVLRMLANGIEREIERRGKTGEFLFAKQLALNLPMSLRRFLFRKIHKTLGGRLKFFGTGSAPLDIKLAESWEALGIEVFEGYGATETTAALTINTPKAKRLGSVGKVLAGMEVKIDSQTGEILAWGPNISPGYFQDPKKTRAAFLNNWYRTGDVGEFDKDKFLYITGREAFRIVLPNGQKVYPEDVERKLNNHPQVLQSCVTGIRRKEGERVHAAIVTNVPKKIDQIIKDVNQQLASHEQIMGWSVWPDDDFPRTPILKIDRKKVSDAVQGIKEEAPRLKIKTEDKLKILIAQVTKTAPAKIKETASLATDLKLDSLGRVELLSLIEQEFGAAVSEQKITPATTVGQLQNLIKEPPFVEEEIPTSEFVYSPAMMRLRSLIHSLTAFPLHSIGAPLQIHGARNLENLKTPAIFYFNHVGIMDGVCALRALPARIRERLVIAVDHKLWDDYRRFWVETFGGGFPFDKEKRVKASLELTGEFLDKGYSLLMSPEGRFTKSGRLLEFKPGIGLLAVEMQVPVVPIRIDPSYREIFPPMEGSFWENIPKKRKRIILAIGKPLTFPKNTPYEEATETMRGNIERL